MALITVCSLAKEALTFRSFSYSHHYIRHAIDRLLQSSDDPILIRVEGPTHVQASTSHSYQTLVSSVCRHMLTSSSVSAGKYSGCFVMSVSEHVVTTDGVCLLTLKGKKMGNHEIMSLLFSSMRSG